MFRSSLITLSLLGPLIASAQQIGTLTTENHPKLTWKKCTTSGGCVSQAASVVLDSNWRWLHRTTSSSNCYTGQAFISECIDGVWCAQNCALDGADYAGTYGVTTSGDSLTHKFVTTGANKNIGSRVYLMDTADTGYQMFKPKNQEFTFDVDVSQLPCGLNGALYFVEMDADGGKSKYPNNAAGAKYGTGYCDAQCPHDIKFINGEGNAAGWTGSTSDVNSGTGTYGTCCPEMDIWEANKISTAFTPHPCSITGQSRCSGTACGDGAERYAGVCDKDGCDFNSYRLGQKTFYGPAATNTIDTTKVVTVVTQFITADGTATGTLSAIRRLYVQNGVVIQNSQTNVSGITATNAISDSFCAQQKTVFGDNNYYQTLGGLPQMGTSFDHGMVLVMSIWDDHAVGMRWLDSNFPDGADPTKPGVARGTCSSTEGLPANVEANFPNAQVKFSNIRFGDIGSTYGTGTGTTSSSSSSAAASASATAAPGGTIPQWVQCGGINWTGSGTCVSGTTCTVINAYYHQCT